MEQQQPVELNAPNRPKDWTVKEMCMSIIGGAQNIRNDALKQGNAEECQQCIRTLDEILKDLAEVQSRIGFYRSELGKHVSSIRQAKPKGKPAEGSVRELADGSRIAFVEGKWVLIHIPPAKE